MKTKAPRLVVALVAVVSLAGMTVPADAAAPPSSRAQRLVLLTASADSSLTARALSCGRTSSCATRARSPDDTAARR